MDVQSLILFLVIGLVAGWLASRIMRSRGVGLLGHMIIGVIGSILGGWLFGYLGISFAGIWGSLLTALVGAVIFLYVVRVIKRV
jgi:uncharacterized membrane protein YeaQ/YmgE (transglycosylase-associated protein family)